MPRRPTIIIVALVVLVALALLPAACGRKQPERTPAPVGSTLEEPGLYELPDGRTMALGILQYREIEDGFWAVVDAADEASARDAKVVVVLVDVEKLDLDLKSMEGSLVSAQGTLSDGVSTRQAGPELLVESLEEVSGMKPSDEATGSTQPTGSAEPTAP